jgi:HEAT repeat protein
MNAKAFRQTCLHGSLGLVAIGTSLLQFGCRAEPSYKTLPASHWLKQMRDKDAANRYQAAHALGEMGPSVEGALQALVRSLEDPHGTVRWEAVKGLAKFGPAAKDAAPALRKCLNDPEQSVRMAAEAALREIVKEAKRIAVEPRIYNQLRQ